MLLAWVLEHAIEPHGNDGLGGQMLRFDATGRDQQAARHAHAEIARRAAVESHSLELAAGRA